MKDFMSDKRIIKDGIPLDYTCENLRFKTNIDIGKPHGGNHVCGSVFNTALIDRTPHSLWLEHVLDKNDDGEWYWLMWYEDGKPSLPASAVLTREDLNRMLALIATFVPLPSDDGND